MVNLHLSELFAKYGCAVLIGHIHTLVNFCDVLKSLIFREILAHFNFPILAFSRLR